MIIILETAEVYCPAVSDVKEFNLFQQGLRRLPLSRCRGALEV